ncbi:hypothetical protein Ancab_006754 [Ancistrocladus abbreviatus]
MGYAYTPAYYSSLQDSITSLCKSILPFSFKKQRLPAAEQKLPKQQSDNLKWNCCMQNAYQQRSTTHQRGLCFRGLAVQGAEIDARDLVVGAASKEGSDEEWSVIDLRDDQCLLNKENSHSKDKSKHASAAIKHVKVAAAVFGFGLSQKLGKKGEEKSIFDLPATKNQILIEKMKMAAWLKTRFGIIKMVKQNPF